MYEEARLPNRMGDGTTAAERAKVPASRDHGPAGGTVGERPAMWRPLAQLQYGILLRKRSLATGLALTLGTHGSGEHAQASEAERHT